ncbi:ribosome biogenesis GTPase Der [Arsenophonus nasoniae]|uniref:GTPase Der n=1 Tax=Arsenophonus nasoniae TaxID=638 RepID=D2TXC9_9GAMM|nr:ribosome biogenesis GTPase Der [Arsenophonus nasoniae]QBY44341.1 GTPase Der [Arsenophonus nasoniae]WGM00570.1 ribosome biogenesis GTPase Der [Arsenophonus nasoniae]WGM04610.1 ribosome biogenesis GTPase Der [Arsenophonus nasoniae]WGM09722.1 ribosome biogenesis GTPase Der [Arsenophonus nasoniae]WGM14441.1 ribosome biogenesis GTPase Der [Arsenophonus nasoniae]
MIPVIALVGRPNVGKSTLFNRLTRTRDALVADFPGLTRDRKYGKAEFAGQEFIIIDTGGIDGSEEGIENHMASQSLLAIEEADIVFFMVDVRSGLMPADHAIAKHLRSRKKETYLLANKTDGLDIDTVLGDFYALGMRDIYPIAASHGRGVTQLIEKVVAPYSPQTLANDMELSEEEANAAYWLAQEEKVALESSEEEAFDPRSLPIKLAIVGRPNVGKSTLTNRILGEERVVVYDLPGTTRDSIYIPMERDGCEYVLIDTAGVRKRGKITETVEKFSVIKTLQSIEDANVVLLVIDARQGISDQDLSLLGFILNAGRSLVIAVNKWDGMSQEDRQSVKDMLDLRLGFIDFAKVHFISALHGSGVGNLFESIQEAYESATRRVGTALLTRIMKMAEEEHQPPLIRGRRVKMKYAHAGGYNPPIVVIHGNQVADLPDSYKRYLMNYFRRTLQVMGTPIRIQFKEGDNPYAGKKNKLTPTQLRKRKRLIAHLKKR